MTEYNAIKVMAEAVAKAQPDHAGQPAFPPQSWRVEGDTLIVLCADGRKVSASMEEIKQLLPGKHAERQAEPHPAAPVAPAVQSLPVHTGKKKS
jgi:hypothetical protein